jgi:predicted transcriptional regulator
MTDQISAGSTGEALRQALAPLGFTEIEAQSYGALLARPDQTGYRLAQAIGKGQPSVYAALTGLEAKGAITATGQSPRTYRAAPPAELLARLRARQDRQFEEAARVLERIAAPPPAGAVAQMTDPDQIYARAAAMIGRARETLIWEMSGGPVAALRPALVAAAARGVRSSGLVLRAEDMVEGSNCIVSPVGDKVATVWPVAPLILVADAREALVAGLPMAGGGREGEALWTDNLLHSVVLHNALASDLLMHRDASPDWVGPNRALFDTHPPGFREFIAAPG